MRKFIVITAVALASLAVSGQRAHAWGSLRFTPIRSAARAVFSVRNDVIVNRAVVREQVIVQKQVNVVQKEVVVQKQVVAVQKFAQIHCPTVQVTELRFPIVASYAAPLAYYAPPAYYASPPQQLAMNDRLDRLERQQAQQGEVLGQILQQLKAKPQ